VSMDTWQEDQIKRMTLGGNGPFLSFVESYTPADHGGYKPGMSPHEKYHCWAAAQYKSKLDADLAGKPWSPSAPPKGQTIDTPSHRPPPRACASRAPECAPTRVASIPHLRAFPTSQTLLRPTPIKRPPTNSILRGSGRLMPCVLKTCHPRKADVIRASGAHPRHRQAPAIHLSTYHLVRFPHFPSCKRIPWVP